MLISHTKDKLEINVTSLLLIFFLSVPYFFLFASHSVIPLIYHIYPTPPLGQDMTQGQFFKRSFTGFSSEFSFF